MAGIPYLVPASILIALVGAVVVMLAGRSAKTAKWTALVFSLPPLALASYAFYAIYTGNVAFTETGYAFYENYRWIPSLGMSVIMGLDGISAPFFWLTTLLTTLAIIFAWDETKRPGTFFGLLLLIDAAVLGVFAVLDLFLFYIFWEFTLVPMFFLINIWGGPRRRYAAIKFFIYTFLASLVMLLGFMGLYFQAGVQSFAFEDIQAQVGAFPLAFQQLTFLALFIGFATKFPVVPVHTWLPDAHVEAPTAGSVILAGILLKMGGYGLIRIALPMAPFGAQWAAPFMFVIAVLSMVYAAVICLAQRDYKKLVAYSSIGSMGLVLLGIAADVQLTAAGQTNVAGLGIVGALVLMFAHGLVSPALFMLCGVLQHNLGTRDIPLMGGLATKMPRTAVLFVAFSMAGLGLPGFAVFVSEFQIYAATWQAFGLLILIPLLYLIFSAAYYLWALERAFFGPFVEHEGVDYKHVYDTHAFELTALIALFAFALLFGLWPDALVSVLDEPTRALLTAVGGA